MIEVYTRGDLERAIERYIQHREITGLSRDTAKHGAVAETVEAVQLRNAVAGDTGLQLLSEAERASKKVTDKLNAPVVES